MFKPVVFTVLMLAYMQSLFPQNFIGRRETVNYLKRQYNAGTQNWEIQQDAQGRMYFANNEGLLVFDGGNWQLYPLPNKTIVWSIAFGADKKLYAGGQDEMGYFAPDNNGQLKFRSIKNLLPKADQNFSDIWDIVCIGNDVYFQSRYKIFRYRNNHVTSIPAFSSWLYMGIIQKQLIVHDEKRGLLNYKDGKWQPFIDKQHVPSDFYITGTAAFGKDTTLITTAKNGLYLLTSHTSIPSSAPSLTPWKLSGFGIDNRAHFAGVLLLKDNSFLISTYASGIYQVDKKGTVIEHISKKEGLQNSNVRAMFTDNNRNVWLGLDNGIDFIAYNNAIKHINPPAFSDGGGFSVAKFKNSLYFALSNGIYQLPISNIKDLSYTPSKIKVLSEGLTWNLSVINDNLLTGRDDGAYQVKNDQLKPIDQQSGYWLFRSLKNRPADIAAGNYYGIRSIKQNDGQLTAHGNIGNYKESARFLEIDGHNNIWTSHPYRGVYRSDISHPLVKVYTKASGLPSTLNNFVFKVKNRVVAATEKGVYEYDYKTDKFKLSPLFKDIFGNKSLRYLKEDPSGNIWFIEGKNLGVVDYSLSKPVIIYLPELNNKILSGFENIYPIDENNVFAGAENGFYHINYAQYKHNLRPVKTYIRKVKAMADTDSLLFGGYFGQVNTNLSQPAAAVPILDHNWNSLHFEYSSSIGEELSNAEYSYFLMGFDNEWSAWSKKKEKDYTNLPSGSYTFKVKVREQQNSESQVNAYAFTIKPPWYRTLWAYAAYLAAFIFLIYYFYKLQEKRHVKKREKELLLQKQQNEEEQKQTAYLHQLELEIAEKELIKLKNEKLETEIEFKNSELASTAMNLVQKKEFLLKVKEELQRLNNSDQEKIETVEIKKILRLLSEEKKLNEEWEQFSVHFNKVHSDFLTVIKERYPSINQQELKLAAYLIMNLSSKEIAQLMAISVRGVEISRYRLRKKMNLPTEVNLFEFLFNIQRECMK